MHGGGYIWAGLDRRTPSASPTAAPPTPADLKHVRCERALDAQYWSQRLGATRQELEDAIEQVGHNIGAVIAYLDRHRDHAA